MIVTRRGFLKKLAAVAAAMTFGAIPSIAAAAKPASVHLDWLRAMGPKHSGYMLGEVRFRAADGDWQLKKFKVTSQQPVVWLTKEVGINLAHAFRS